MTNSATVTTLYAVKIGDTMSSLSQQFFGEPGHEADIAQANGISPSAILPFGTRLKIPQPQAPAPVITSASASYPDGSPVLGQDIASITATADRLWWQHWQVWAGALAVGGVIWWMTRRKS